MSVTLSLSLQALPKAAPVNKNVFLVNMPCLIKDYALKRATQGETEGGRAMEWRNNSKLNHSKGEEIEKVTNYMKLF